MKNIFRTGLISLMALFVFTGCDPEERDGHSLGRAPQESDLNFTINSTDNANVFTLVDTSTYPGIAVWDLGNGVTTKGSSVKAEYPFAGEYTIMMTLYTEGGSVAITKEITVAQDDMSLLDTPLYNALTGGAANLEGKTWVFDQYHDGHFGVGPELDDEGNPATSPGWWPCPANGKDLTSLYKQEFTFIQVGVEFIWTNNDSIYTNEPGWNALGNPPALENPGGQDDYDVYYVPKDRYTFILNENDKTLTLSDGAFFGHYAGTSRYEIITLTENELYVRCASTVENENYWYYRFIPKELNVKPEVPLRGVALAENFENETPNINFEGEDMGDHFSLYYQNPLPLPINTSSRVCLYDKSEALYMNLSYTASNYKFDLTEINKVRMLVYLPGGNTYTTGKLQPQVAVKLQNSDQGDNAWETQTEIVKTDLDTDKWVELEFDFSSVSDREDYDKIVIQFGGEGHDGTGIFYLDDFSFDK
ncbi:MAG: PKD domain-containing protein [Bacteroides sp.]|nr:PKD domain-containing protein [Bacteroides sp.]